VALNLVAVAEISWLQELEYQVAMGALEVEVANLMIVVEVVVVRSLQRYLV